MSTDQHDLIRPTPYKRDPRVAQHGKHRPETVGATFLAAGLIDDPEHYQRVARWAHSLRKAAA